MILALATLCLSNTYFVEYLSENISRMAILGEIFLDFSLDLTTDCLMALEAKLF